MTDLVTRLYQCTVAQLLEERVFKPCGFTETGWRVDRTEDLVWQGETYTGTNGNEPYLFVSTRELAYWGYLHLVGGRCETIEITHPQVFRRTVTVQTPTTLPPLQPRNGFMWFVQHTPSRIVEIGDSLPVETFQILGVTGCACLVIPEFNIVAVRMYNQNGKSPAGYDYLRDIKTWGNLVLDCATAHIG